MEARDELPVLPLAEIDIDHIAEEESPAVPPLERLGNNLIMRSRVASAC